MSSSSQISDHTSIFAKTRPPFLLPLNGSAAKSVPAAQDRRSRGIALLLIIPRKREKGKRTWKVLRARTGARKCAGVCRLSPFNRTNVWEITAGAKETMRGSCRRALWGVCFSRGGLREDCTDPNSKWRGSWRGWQAEVAGWGRRRGCWRGGGYPAATAHPRRRPFHRAPISLPFLFVLLVYCRHGTDNYALTSSRPRTPRSLPLPSRVRCSSPFSSRLLRILFS